MINQIDNFQGKPYILMENRQTKRLRKFVKSSNTINGRSTSKTCGKRYLTER